MKLFAVVRLSRRADDTTADVIPLVMRRYQSRLVNPFRKVRALMDAEQRETEEEDEADVAADLVRRIRAGDTPAESQLVRRYGERLRYVLRRQMAAYPHDVDDIIQDALTTAILKLRDEGLDDPARLGGFIYGIAKNLRLAKLREHARHDGAADPAELPEVADDVGIPERVVAGQETTRLVRQLLAEFGDSRGRERDREILIRLYIRQQSREEVCEALDITPAHFRRVIHRAKQRLKMLVIESIGQQTLWQTDD